jgi:V8-like Glu-specific endopeptidase
MPSDTQLPPNNAVVFIDATFPGGDEFGSGVLISPDEVLTASHIVFDSVHNEVASSIKVEGFDADAAHFEASGLSGYFNPIQFTPDLISDEESQLDYAVIHLSSMINNPTTMGLSSDFADGMATVSGYPTPPGFNPTDTSPVSQASRMESVTLDPNFTLLDGLGLGDGSSGGPVWITDSNNNPLVVGIASSAAGNAGSPASFTQITAAALDTIETWVADDDQPTPGLGVRDMTFDQSLGGHRFPYQGPVAGVENQYIEITTDKLNVSVATPNWFIHTGSGEDAIAVSSGTNVLDGGAGSNFLTGGSGSDTFFVDDRDPSATIWSTVVGFHAGDDATIWGVTPNDFNFTFANDQGAPGFTGLTLEATATGKSTAKLTLTGFSRADITSGRLSISSGIDPVSGSEAHGYTCE